MKRYAMLFTIAMTLLLSVSLLVAQPMGKGQRGDRGQGKGFMNLPNLTDEQMTQMHKLRLEHQKEMLPLQTKIKTARLEMQQLMMDQADQKTVEKKIEEIGKLKIDVAKMRYAHHLAVRNILTDEQKAVFDSHPMGMGRRGMWNDDDDNDGPDCLQGPQHRRW
ncbi:Spy/CpxP family protein refolding chaperone [candidate division KSB1 bacterium]|nr:Spy/CpxP family protein refolding chaperone [candidate division KSB1 bacterium]